MAKLWIIILLVVLAAAAAALIIAGAILMSIKPSEDAEENSEKSLGTGLLAVGVTCSFIFMSVLFYKIIDS